VYGISSRFLSPTLEPCKPLRSHWTVFIWLTWCMITELFCSSL